jgi:hypothetical protein
MGTVTNSLIHLKFEEAIKPRGTTYTFAKANNP